MLLKADSPVSVEPYELVESEFLSGRFRWLDIIFRRWASQIQDTLYSEMNLMFDVASTNVVWMRFENLLHEVAEQPIYIFETVNQSRGMLLIDNTFLHWVLDQYEEEAMLRQLPLDQLMKKHQKRLLAMVRPMISDFEKSWLNIAEVKLDLKRVTTHARRAHIMLPFERCMVGRIRLSCGEGQSEILLCLPYTALHKVLSPLEQKKILPPESMEYYYSHVEDHYIDLLKNTEHTVIAELGKADLRGTEGKLEEGQVLPLIRKDEQITVKINGTDAIKGTLGESDGRYSVQMVRRVEDKKPSAIQPERQFKQVDWPNQ